MVILGWMDENNDNEVGDNGYPILSNNLNNKSDQCWHGDDNNYDQHINDDDDDVFYGPILTFAIPNLAMNMNMNEDGNNK